jgi:hypothetical protein
LHLSIILENTFFLLLPHCSPQSPTPPQLFLAVSTGTWFVSPLYNVNQQFSINFFLLGCMILSMFFFILCSFSSLMRLLCSSLWFYFDSLSHSTLYCPIIIYIYLSLNIFRLEHFQILQLSFQVQLNCSHDLKSSLIVVVMQRDLILEQFVYLDYLNLYTQLLLASSNLDRPSYSPSHRFSSKACGFEEPHSRSYSSTCPSTTLNF